MTIQRRKRATSESHETVEEGGWISSEDDDDDDDESRDDDDCNDDSSKCKADGPAVIPYHKSCFNVCTALTALLIIGFIAYLHERPRPLNFREKQLLDSGAQSRPDHVRVIMEEEEGLDTLPPIELDPKIAKDDAYGVAQQYLKKHTSSFMGQAQELQSEFARLHGGIRPARHLLENSLKELGQQDAWARLLQRKQNDVLHMVVLGNATAAGYGNLHSDAFSFGLENMVKNVMKSFHIDFKVTNVALEHVADFPYLWCIPEFTGTADDTIDIVYLDLGPSLTAQHLELALRQVMGLSSPAPLLILRDSKDDKDRKELLEHYVEGGILQAPVLMEWKDAVDPFLQVKKSRRPDGFEGWDDWGTTNAPHLESYWTATQHQMVSWILSMFFLKHLELLVAHNDGLYEIKEDPQQQQPSLHAPILAKASALKDPWSKYVYHTSSSRNCRTSFDPADNLKVLEGSSTQEVLVEQPKGMLFYTSGWVLDMENSERKEKIRSQHLGFKDVLASYHGLPASGTLKFELDATTSDFVVCGTHQSEPQPKACRLDKDVTMTVNSKPVKSVTQITMEAASYLGDQNCFFVQLDKKTKGNVILGVEVTNERVTLSKGPCSISHIIWQEDDDDAAAGWDTAL